MPNHESLSPVIVLPNGSEAQGLGSGVIISDPTGQVAISNSLIEPRLGSSDIIFVTRSANVDEYDVGLALYLTPSDLGRTCGSKQSAAHD